MRNVNPLLQGLMTTSGASQSQLLSFSCYVSLHGSVILPQLRNLFQTGV